MADLRKLYDPKKFAISNQENHMFHKKKEEVAHDKASLVEPQIIIEEKLIDKSGNLQVKRYVRGKFLGKGGFAKCYEVREIGSDRVLAAKIVSKSTLIKPRAKQKLTAEIKIHRSLNHQSIVRFEHFFEDSENVYILLEMCNQKSMMELLKRRKTITEMETRYYMLQLIHATKYMHSLRIIHRDLKLGNLFLDNMQIKIGDFGLAAKLDHDGQRKKTICGTPNYIAPEILEGPNGHSYEVDVWALGVIMYTLIVGKPPFETSDVKQTYQLIKTNSYSFPEGCVISEAAKSLIRQILHLVPECRPSLDTILGHAWFTGGHPVPRTLPASALNVPPSPSKILSPTKKSTIPSSYLAQALTIGVGSKSPSRVPLAEKTNHNTASPRRNIMSEIMTSEENIEHRAKTRKVEKTKENSDVRGLFLKPKRLSSEYASEPLTSSTTLRSLTQQTVKNAGGGLLAASTTSTKSSNSTVSSIGSAISLPGMPVLTYTFPPESHLSPPHSSLHTKAQQNHLPDLLDQDDDELGNLHLMHQKLVASFVAGPSMPHLSTMHPVAPPKVWVSRWVDYSTKYGLGYSLSNGISGAYFNDSTKIVTANFRQCEYIENSREERRIISLDSSFAHPHELTKKITLLKYFKSYLDEQGIDDSIQIPLGPAVAATSTHLPYVKKWLRTKHAIIFRISNKTVQVNFFDHTKLILSSEATVVTYIDLHKNTTTRALQSVLLDPPSEELVERLKYTRDILFHMINSQKKSSKPK